MDEEVIPYSARITPHYPNFPEEPKSSRRHAPRRQKNHNDDYNPPNSARVRPPSHRKDGLNPNNRRNPRTARNAYRVRFRKKSTTPVVSNGPISPEEARVRFSDFLTAYEMEEILSFPDIYYVGKLQSKIEVDPNDEYNQGLDDETNNYKLVVGGHLAYRFEIVSLFGAGAFGQVVRCFDHKKKCPVAIKVIVNTEQMHEQGQIEAQILSKLNAKEQHHIVKAFDFFIFRSHICITFEILGINLFELSQQNEFKPLPIRLIRLYALQMFSALEQCHRVGAIHCDIKPENILLVPGSNALIKLIDFGSSCFEGHQKYEYIQSRFYRAPEVIIGTPYGPPMDVWSTALVLIELMIGQPLFPGDDEEEQLAMIASLLGEPPVEMVEQGKRKEEFFDIDNKMCENEHTMNRKPGSMNLSTVLQTNDRYLLDFLMRCLTWDPKVRLTAQQAMQHPWIRMKEVTLPQRQTPSNAKKNLPAIKTKR
ncbi:CMGC family protein kinase [Tritrichomonas foetus]|uniref:dual-specificity kinase n=1 Tax=Tritrichomonas foetus TaxID=1144522 RepID=A0A1J4KYV0_9EUKA|nr:CMGC family protein kinase [Tritrichomonas foetus]|eukprot:OHT16425.1 CMGC family protein kinase [Tritrichomonas foetus]